MPKMVGGTDVMVYKGKAYYVGDDVPMGEKEARDAEANGARWEKPYVEPVPPEDPLRPAPRDDRGAPMEMRGDRVRAEHPTAPSGAKSE